VIRCSKGCASADAEWCSECGAKMPAPPCAPAAPPAAPVPREPCPDCGTPRAARFCERCRYDFLALRSSSSRPVAAVEAAASAGGLELVVSSDASSGREAPPADQVPVFRLEGRELLVGRRSDVKDIHPDVPLNEDAGVSHRHAKLVREADGGWVVVDLGSSNGTELNGTLLGPGERTKLHVGDELRLGICTVLRVREH
jgi:hypothetical protein